MLVNTYGVSASNSLSLVERNPVQIKLAVYEAVYENPKHVYVEGDYQALEKSMQLSEKVFPESSSEGMVLRGKNKQDYQGLLCLFTIKASIYLSKWHDLCAMIGKVPFEWLISSLLSSAVEVPANIYLSCLQRLVGSIANIGVRFAALFREMTPAAIILNVPLVIVYLLQVCATVNFTKYPQEELMWLHSTCSAMASTMRGWKNEGKACEYHELVISYHRPEDKIYESRNKI